MLKIRKKLIDNMKGGLRAVSIFEAGKGVLVFSLALFLSTFVSRDLPGIIAEFRTHWNVDPSSHIPALAKMLMHDLTGSRLHFLIMLAAATLWAMLFALGEPAGFAVPFAAFVVATIVATLSLIPLGLGSFELTCAGLLVSLGARLETALTATLLLRGFTVWLPMIPGLLLTRRELR
jgi:hypothetical protein